MSIEELLAKVDEVVVNKAMVTEMMARLAVARKESQEAAIAKAVDEKCLALTCSL
jgi:hypothetical protein